ncbi:MAG: hypothetical protein LC659_08365, partial [Myxococcales bacterium]|nr:hypothetical protein [Myxococcales bacterium]
MRALVIALGIASIVLAARADERPHHTLKKAQHGGTVIGLCDGQTSTEVDVAPGRALTPQQAQAASDKLMKEWRDKHPEARWDDTVAQNTTPSSDVGHGAGTSKQNAPPSGGSQKRGPEVLPQPTTSTRAPA